MLYFSYAQVGSKTIYWNYSYLKARKSSLCLEDVQAADRTQCDHMCLSKCSCFSFSLIYCKTFVRQHAFCFLSHILCSLSVWASIHFYFITVSGTFIDGTCGVLLEGDPHKTHSFIEFVSLFTAERFSQLKWLSDFCCYYFFKVNQALLFTVKSTRFKYPLGFKSTHVTKDV